MEKVRVEVAEAGAAVDGVAEEDVVVRMLDVVGSELRGVEAIGLVDEMRELLQLFVIRIALEVVVVDEARRGRRETVATLE